MVHSLSNLPSAPAWRASLPPSTLFTPAVPYIDKRSSTQVVREKLSRFPASSCPPMRPAPALRPRMFLKYASTLSIIAVAGGEASAANYTVMALQDVGGVGLKSCRKGGAGSVPRRGCRSPSSRKVSLSGHLTAMTYLVQIIYFLPLLRRTLFRTPHDRDGPHHLPLVRVSGLPVRNWMPATA